MLKIFLNYEFAVSKFNTFEGKMITNGLYGLLWMHYEPVFWQKSPGGTGKQTAKTWFGLEK
jgi:hypothetical protein